MGTAVSGLSAQSSAFSNISDNISNSQTVGYKRVDTGFEDYLTTSTAAINDPGSVVARPDYANNVQGSVTQTDNPLALAISGQGFFAVSEENGQNNGLPTFSAQQEYTRAGDFQMDKNGYLVNGSGAFLNGWAVDPTTGAVNRNTLAPIQINQAALSPVPTSSISLAANLPATPDAGTPVSSQVQVYDSLGTPHTVALNWTQVGPDHWSVAVNVPDDATSANRGTADVKFGPSSGNGVADGTIGSVTGGSGSVTASPYSANGAATLSFTTNFGTGTPQTIQINLGTYGQASGVTQWHRRCSEVGSGPRASAWGARSLGRSAVKMNVAIVQTKPRKGDLDANLASLEEAFRQLHAQPPDLVALPEAALTGYFLEGAVYELAQEAAVFADRLGAAWKRSGARGPVEIVCGFYENDAGTYYNSALYATLARDGSAKIAHVHRKLFLPTYGVFDEERFHSRGRRLETFATPFGRAAIMICEDAWHAIVPTIAAIKGARIFLIPSASPGRGIGLPGELENVSHWRNLLQNYAAEHGVFIIYAGLAGFEGGKGMTGSSQIVGPRGNTIVEAGLLVECIVRATLDLSEIELARASLPLLGDLNAVLPDLVAELG